MQALIDKFGTNATYLAGALVALLVLILAIFLINAIFGGRIRASGGGRSRQPRLGVVDAYDLDRQRQLVLVRRDNVEHLVMIGGPNDVLIESTIIRSTAAGEVRPRVASTFDEPQPAMAPHAAASPPLAPPPAPVPAPAPVLRSPPPTYVPAPSVPSMDELVQAVTPPRPVPAPPPAPPKVAPPPVARPLPKLEVPAAPAPTVPVPAAPQAAAVPVAPAVSGVSATKDAEPARKRFDFGRLVNRTPAEPALQVPSEPIPAAAAVASSAPPVTGPDPVDALEQEMAKLLGRPPAQGA